jgi:prefoldin subunit 5
MVEFLASAQGDECLVDYQLSDNIWSKATIQRSGNVSLWLGANVMLEYSYEDALELLNRNLDGAKT